MTTGRKHYRKMKNVVVFLTTLIIVICIGMVFIGFLNYNKKKQNVLVYEFFDLPSNEMEKFADTSLAQEWDKNQEVYQNALELNQNVKMIPCIDENVVTMLFAGDTLLDDGYAVMSNFRDRGSDYESTFPGGLLQEMQMADVFMLNNEFTFTNRGNPVPGKKYTFRSNPDNIAFLQNIGVDVVSLANNHAYDFGEISLLDTMDTLKNGNIHYVGAGKNLKEAKEPFYIVANGMKIAFIAATQLEKYANPETKGATEESPGTLRCMDPQDLLDSIRIAEENADLTILYIHWGTESVEWIDEQQKTQVNQYVDAGVDLIIGAHPHVLQKIEYVNQVPVVYSLGNFWFNSKERDTGVVKVKICDKKIQSVQFMPCKQVDCRTVLLSGEEKEQVLSKMREMSLMSHIDADGYVTMR